ncbi:uncharacterized protein LOC105689951 [Athalia rosae]|uniref:uncharacterized protein LOC105689951 n=1 Tax=Athalia rosae TaxID=37344 RepID=UPI0020342F5B|nr:uncharacterized protein LOC105689951 [Athalia rosae]
MKCLSNFAALVIIAGFLVQDSHANDNCDSNDKVDMYLLIRNYVKGVQCVPDLVLEAGDLKGGEFSVIYTNISTNYGQSVFEGLYAQAKNGTEDLVCAVQSINNELQKAIKSIERNHRPICLTDLIRNLTNQCRTFLKLLPGNVQIKRRALPDLPTPYTEVVSTTTIRPLSDIFINFAELLNKDFSNLLAYIFQIYVAGWANVRNDFNTLQEQFRNEFLNDWALKDYKCIVESVYAHCETIKNNVELEQWEEFKTVGDQIIAIWNDYQASKNKNCD